MGGLPTGTVNGFAVDPANPRVMLVAMREGIFRSEDKGGQWTTPSGAPKNAAAVTVNPRQRVTPRRRQDRSSSVETEGRHGRPSAEAGRREPVPVREPADTLGAARLAAKIDEARQGVVSATQGRGD